MIQKTQYSTIFVTIPEFENRIMVAKKSRRTGKPVFWNVNGQSLYNATLHYASRAKVTKYFHKYLSKFIKEQITKEQITSLISHELSVSVDIYEINKGILPDVGNLWIWIKWFEDALQICKVIPNDNSKIIIESGRTRYRWVETNEERKLVFQINIV